MVRKEVSRKDSLEVSKQRKKTSALLQKKKKVKKERSSSKSRKRSPSPSSSNRKKTSKKRKTQKPTAKKPTKKHHDKYEDDEYEDDISSLSSSSSSSSSDDNKYQRDDSSSSSSSDDDDNHLRRKHKSKTNRRRVRVDIRRTVIDNPYVSSPFESSSFGASNFPSEVMGSKKPIGNLVTFEETPIDRVVQIPSEQKYASTKDEDEWSPDPKTPKDRAQRDAEFLKKSTNMLIGDKGTPSKLAIEINQGRGSKRRSTSDSLRKIADFLGCIPHEASNGDIVYDCRKNELKKYQEYAGMCILRDTPIISASVNSE